MLGLLASTVLFYAIYRILGHPPRAADRTLWQGALLGAAGFEVLKFLVVNVIGALGGSAFAPLAIAVTLAVWINYFSKLVVYGAAWAMTSPLTSRGAASPRPSPRLPSLHDPVAVDPPAAGSTTPVVRVDASTPGSAVIGAIAGFLASLIFRRPS